MLNKEFKEVLKQYLYLILVMILLPAVLKIFIQQSYFEIFFPLFQVGLLFWALLMGNFIFSLDRAQRGMEYLLSLPYSRLQLIGLKFLPRLGAVLIFFMLHLLIYSYGGSNAAAISLFSFTLLYFSLFLIAFSFSAVSENFVVSSIISIFFLSIYLSLLYLSFYLTFLIKEIPFYWGNIHEFFTIQEWPYLIRSGSVTAIVLILPFFFSFLFAFKKFDIRPARIYNKHFFKYFIPLLIAGFIISSFLSYLGLGSLSNDYFLTQNNILLESGYDYLKIYNKENIFNLKRDFFLWKTIEKENYIIGKDYTYNGKSFSHVFLRLDLNNNKVTSLYEIKQRKYFGSDSFKKFKNDLIFIEKGDNSSEFELVFVNINSGKIKRLKVDHALDKHYKPLLFGTDTWEGKRFWLVSMRQKQKYAVLQIWEDGKINNLGISQTNKINLRPGYTNRMLFVSTPESLNIYRLFPSKKELLKEIPGENNFLKFSPYSQVQDIANYPLKEVYGKKGNKIIRLDLGDLTIQELGEYEGQIVYIYPNTFYFREQSNDIKTLRLHRLKDGKIYFLKEFHLTGIKKNKSLDRISIFKTGVVARIKGKVKIYSLPDLKEIKFKGL